SLARTQEVRIRARLRGTLRSPTLTFDDAGGVGSVAARSGSVGGAPMTQEELLSYLVTGQPAFALGAGDAYKELARTELSSRVARTHRPDVQPQVGAADDRHLLRRVGPARPRADAAAVGGGGGAAVALLTAAPTGRAWAQGPMAAEPGWCDRASRPTDRRSR